MPAYYNEIDAHAAQWLRNLIAAGEIPAGDVDTRDIADVCPGDLAGYGHCHFFAGVGGWPLALRLAGWPADRPVWTGSCPCQPFSAAGKGKAFDDDRHLWPRWLPLIAECRPPTIFEEQVAAAIGWGWIDAVFADLEARGYACGQAVLPACGVGAPHRRDRLWFVADAHGGVASDGNLQRGRQHRQQPQDGMAGVGLADLPGERWGQGVAGLRQGEPIAVGGRDVSAMADDAGDGRGQGHPVAGGRGAGTRAAPERRRPAHGGAGGMGDGDPSRPSPRQLPEQLPGEIGFAVGRAVEQPGRSFWADVEWLACADGKARPTQPGLHPLAHGVSGRVAVRRPGQPGGTETAQERWVNRRGAIRGFGNAIVPQEAAEFVAAFMEGWGR